MILARRVVSILKSFKFQVSSFKLTAPARTRTPPCHPLT